ncbi:MAG: hypothetical protein RJA22_1318 [Verrucomicrobiota bacterium]|jgi:hypothetical protein
MSLKAFHVVFIIASILLAFGFAGWSWFTWRTAGPATYLWFAIGSGVVGCALVVYFAYVLKKLRNESYL